MQRIIDGYIYDTEKSILLWVDDGNGRRYYATPNSRYFIVFPTGEFKVVTVDFMKTLLGKYDIERYKEVFGEPKEG